MGWKISKWPKSYGSLRLEKRSCLVKDSAYRRIARAGISHAFGGKDVCGGEGVRHILVWVTPANSTNARRRPRMPAVVPNP